MDGARTSVELRAHNRVRLLRAVHECGAGRTRSELTRDLDLARGTASVLVTGLIDDDLVSESPTPGHARGRPTQVPGPHPHGPLVLAADLREDAWDLAVCEIGGRTTVVDSRSHDGSPTGALPPLGDAIRAQLGPRVVGVGVAVAGPVRSGRIVDIAHLSWRDVDVAELLAVGHAPLHIGNDARLAGLAEARRGRLRGVDLGLHLHVDFDPGGTLLVNGTPLAGGSGTAGEFGHMPLADPSGMPADRRRHCACGAQGCWSLQVGGNALLDHFGLTTGGGRGRSVSERILADAARGDPAAVEAVAVNARALGMGIGALVNALDPRVVTLSGMGTDLLALARDEIEAAYLAGLMAFRRPRPAEIAPSTLDRRGPLIGAMESAFDAFLTVPGLQGWRASHARSDELFPPTDVASKSAR
ncbi:ROK family protein [Streptosporangium sp. KLBMP 9127]|nr:ROK family protein [Streptosporangium sp. KLBMP 9127]